MTLEELREEINIEMELIETTLQELSRRLLEGGIPLGWAEVKIETV